MNETKVTIRERVILPVMLSALPTMGIRSIGNVSSTESGLLNCRAALKETFERKNPFGSPFYMTWATARATDVNIDIHLDRLRVDIGWSSTHRSIAEAQAAITLYQQVTNYAAAIQAVMDSLKDSREYKEAPERENQ